MSADRHPITVLRSVTPRGWFDGLAFALATALLTYAIMGA